MISYRYSYIDVKLDQNSQNKEQHSIIKWALIRHFTSKQKITSASYAAAKWAVDCIFRLTSFRDDDNHSHTNTTERLQHFDVLNTYDFLVDFIRVHNEITQTLSAPIAVLM